MESVALSPSVDNAGGIVSPASYATEEQPDSCDELDQFL